MIYFNVHLSQLDGLLDTVLALHSVLRVIQDPIALLIWLWHIAVCTALEGGLYPV